MSICSHPVKRHGGTSPLEHDGRPEAPIPFCFPRVDYRFFLDAAISLTAWMAASTWASVLKTPRLKRTAPWIL